MLTGSVAASYHGRPRATHDFDVVIDPTPAQLESLVRGLLAADFYVDPERAGEALRSRRPFNVIDTLYACKIDLIIRRDRPFSREEFERRVIADLSLGRPVTIVSAEDVVVSKLEWARLAGSALCYLRSCIECVCNYHDDHRTLRRRRNDDICR
jgi:hypothetical protein